MHFTSMLKKLFFVSLFSMLLFSFPSETRAQNDPMDIFLDGLKQLDNILLDMTALSDEDENSIGKELDAQICREVSITKNEQGWKISKIMNKLLKKITRGNIAYRYKVIQEPEVNAFAIAGGQIYLTTGFLQSAESEDELAFVIAHELSHIELKHCIHRVQHAYTASQIDPSLGEIVQVAYSVYLMPYSKNDEFAADDGGVRLMEKAGYKRQGAIDFFKKLAIAEAEYGQDQRDPVNDFISSHPMAKERLERVKKVK